MTAKSNIWSKHAYPKPTYNALFSMPNVSGHLWSIYPWRWISIFKVN